MDRNTFEFVEMHSGGEEARKRQKPKAMMSVHVQLVNRVISENNSLNETVLFHFL